MLDKKPRVAGLFACGRAILLFALLGSSGAAHAWQCDAAQVLRVHDGDTLTVRCGDARPVKLRIANIDAPELHQAYGEDARDALIAHIDGKALAVQSVAVDRYERVVARIAVDGDDVGAALVAEGAAWCGTRPSAACRRALESAKAARRGLWAATQPQAPWEWRREHPRAD